MMEQSTPKTRERLIDNAANLFHNKGFSDTSVAEVLRGANANSGSLYYFFKNKEDLLLAVVTRYRELLYPTIIEPAFSRETDPIKRIFAILGEYRRLLIETGCTRGWTAPSQSHYSHSAGTGRAQAGQRRNSPGVSGKSPTPGCAGALCPRLPG